MWTWQTHHIVLLKESNIFGPFIFTSKLLFYRTELEKHYKDRPASFVVNISSYSSRILSSRSLSSLSHIIPTCLRENKGCSFLPGEVAAGDVPVRWEINTNYWLKMETFGTPNTAPQPDFSPHLIWKVSCFSMGAYNYHKHYSSSFNTIGWKWFILHQCKVTWMNGTTLHRHLLCWLSFSSKQRRLLTIFLKYAQSPYCTLWLVNRLRWTTAREKLKKAGECVRYRFFV